MAEVADIEKAEKNEAHARALKEEPVKQGLAQRILREQANVQLLKSEKVEKVDDLSPTSFNQLMAKEEFLRTEYYKDFHKGYYHSKFFDELSKK